jgi:Tol biopolymer transport system component
MNDLTDSVIINRHIKSTNSLTKKFDQLDPDERRIAVSTYRENPWQDIGIIINDLVELHREARMNGEAM